MEKHWCIKITKEVADYYNKRASTGETYMPNDKRWLSSHHQSNDKYIVNQKEGNRMDGNFLIFNNKNNRWPEITYKEFLEIIGEKKEELHYSIFN